MILTYCCMNQVGRNSECYSHYQYHSSGLLHTDKEMDLTFQWDSTYQLGKQYKQKLLE